MHVGMFRYIHLPSVVRCMTVECEYMCIYVYMFMCICMYACMYVCVYVCMCIYVCMTYSVNGR